VPEPPPSRATATKPRGRPGYDQQSVLKIAVDVFNQRGFEATSMGILAGTLGITKSAIYHHVSSKGDLLRLALDRGLDGLEGILQESGASEGLAADQLEYVLRQSRAAGLFLLPEYRTNPMAASFDAATALVVAARASPRPRAPEAEAWVFAASADSATPWATCTPRWAGRPSSSPS